MTRKAVNIKAENRKLEIEIKMILSKKTELLFQTENQKK